MSDEQIFFFDYRVVRHIQIHEAWHAEPVMDRLWIHAVYYDAAGSICTFIEEAHAPFGNTPQELRGDLEKMAKAFERPVIEMADLLALGHGHASP